MNKNFMRLAALAVALFPGLAIAQTSQITPLTTFGVNGDGSIRPGERSYLTDASALQRGLAFNPVTGNLLLANRSPVSAPTIHVLDGATGADVAQMPFEPLVLAGNTSFYLNKIGVADDGAIYVGNLTSASTATIGYALYRYSSESGEQTMVYFGDPSNGAATSSQSNGRWGDTMAVRGAGTNTQILIASMGTLVAILRPTDESVGTFTATTLTTTASSGALGDSVSFGEGDTFWGKSGGGTLRHLSFDLNAGTTTLLQTYPSTGFPTRVGPIHNLVSSNLLAGIEVIPNDPDIVKLYDVSNLANNPVLLDRAAYPTNIANNIYGGSICSGNGKLYALNSDSGILAFDLVTGNESHAPTFILQPVGTTSKVGSNVVLSAAVDGVPVPTSFQWYFNETNAIANATNLSLTLSNAQISDSGMYSMVAVNTAGMATSSVATVTIVPENVLYLYEPFDYTVGQKVTDFTLGPGQTWTTNGTTANDTLIAPNNITITGLAPSIGYSITNGGGGAAARLPMGASQNSGSIYASFAMKIDSLGSYTGNALIASFVNQSANDQQARLLIQKSGAGYVVGVAKVTTAQGVYAPTVFSEGETVFVVLRYTFVSGSSTNDEVSLWLNPDPSTFGNANAPTPTVAAAITGTDVALINEWAFRQNSSANTPAILNYDELRIANQWSLVTPTGSVAVPISLGVSKSGGNVVLSWPISGSSGFTLQSAAGLSSPVTWSAVAQPVVVQGENNTVTLPTTGNHSFYRLIK